MGLIAGLRTMTAPAAVSWAARWDWLDLSASSLAFFGYAFTPWVLTALGLVELVTDQLPSTPSRTVPVQFGARLISGGLCGTVIGVASGAPTPGLAAGVAGAVAGTLGGRAARGKLAAVLGSDPPAAFLEDAVAIGGAALIVMALR